MTTAAPAAPAAPATPAAPPAGAGAKAPEPKAPTTTPAAPAAPKAPDGSAPAAPPAGGAEAAKKRKYVVDGAEHEVDLADDKALEVLIQKGLGADRRFKEAAKYRRDAEIIAQLMRSNPMAVVEKAAQLYGLDGRKVVEEWLWKNHVELESLPADKREAELNRRELERLRGLEKQTAEEQKAAKHEAAKNHYRQHFERDIMGALETSGLPKSPRTVERMAHYILQAHKVGVKVSAAEVAPLVRADYEQEFRELTGPMDADVLSGLLGEGTLKRLRERELAKLKAQGHQPPPPPPPPGPPAPQGEKKRQTMEEWKASLDKRVPLR